MENINDFTNIQTELHAPKNQLNKFGGYKYRSCEDILEAVKPILLKYGAYLTITDHIEMIGDRYYIRAEATITLANGKTISTSAYAREPITKKGMDDSQITGTASSYARKYALNGLFLIDDTKDADTNEVKEQEQAAKKAQERARKAEPVNPPARQQNAQEQPAARLKGELTDEQVTVLENICKKYGKAPNEIFPMWPNLTQEQYGEALRRLDPKGEHRKAV